jgi:hypothetical protein
MPITVGNGTITGISSGGLPNSIVTGTTVADSNVTTDKLVSSLYTNSKSNNGYAYLPNGMLFQWGTATTASTSLTVTYPISFPTACGYICIYRYVLNDTGGIDTKFLVGGSSTLGTSSHTFSVTSGFTIYWQALGY